MINLRKLAEQQKEQRALKIENRNLKQTHDTKLAESLSPLSRIRLTNNGLAYVFQEANLTTTSGSIA